MKEADPKRNNRPSTTNIVARSHVEWTSGMAFTAGVMDRTQPIDGNSKTAPSPVETLLGAVGTCAASDVVEILTKQRTPPTQLSVDVMATRRVEHPRRVEKLQLMFHIKGPSIERAAAERAIDLSIQKYCTVAASLAGDMEMSSILVLNGEPGQPVKQAMFSKNFKV
jgi:putative redox protein